MNRLLLLFSLIGCASSPTQTINMSEYRKSDGVTNPTIYMFSNEECRPCREARPVVEREARQRGDRVIMVNADDQRLMKRLGYHSLPVFRFVKPGAPDLVLKGWDRKRFEKAYNHFDDTIVKR